MNKLKLKFQIVLQVGVLIGLLSTFNMMTYGNSGPTIMEEYPGSEVIVDESSEIIVNHETLIFDLSNDLYTEGTAVKAIYEMQNSSDETQNVHMVFPLVSTGEMLENNAVINCDGKPVVVEKIYLNRLTSPNDLPDFQTLLKQITEQEQRETHFLESDFICYEFIPQVVVDELNLEVQFSLSDENALIFVQNSNGYGYDSNSNVYLVNSWTGINRDPSESLKIYVEEGELEALKYTVRNRDNDEAINENAEIETFKVEQKAISNLEMHTILESVLFEKNIDLHTPETRRWMIDDALYECYITNGISLIPFDDVRQYLYQDRVILLSYDIEFTPNQSREITVSYKMKGTYDRRSSSEPTYTFEYFFKPASYWKAFKQLEIEIHLKKPYEYIVSSSLPFTREVNQGQVSYTALLDQLPEDDLTFSVYTSDKVSLWDQLKGKWNREYSYVFFFIGYFVGLPVMFVASLFAIVVGIRFIVKRIKNKGRS